MASSFLDHERNNSVNDNPAVSENELASHKNTDHDGQSQEELAILLAAGDGNMNVLSNIAAKSSKNFMHQEAVSSATVLSTGKRKREQSPEIFNKEIVDGSKEGEGSSLESDAEENASDVQASLKNQNQGSKTFKSNAIDDELPDTVTLLKTREGAKIYLVGTAHFSLESQEDVAKIIRAVQPHVVLVELCKSRVNILQLDEKTILEEAKNINFEKIHSTIKQNGLFNGMMYILLLNMSAHITKQLGMAPGGEFRKAFAEAKRFPHCIVHLGDRPIHITLQRAISSLSWWQTIRLTWHLIMSKGPISKEEVERCKRRDLLEEMLAEMTGEFPDLSTVFVKERDMYLTHSLQIAASIPQPSYAGGELPRIVGVVGIGHLPGIVQLWGKVQPEDIPPLLYVPPPTLASRILRVGVKLSVVGIVLWGCSKIVPIPKVVTKLSAVKTALQISSSKIFNSTT